MHTAAAWMHGKLQTHDAASGDGGGNRRVDTISQEGFLAACRRHAGRQQKRWENDRIGDYGALSRHVRMKVALVMVWQAGEAVPEIV